MSNLQKAVIGVLVLLAFVGCSLCYVFLGPGLNETQLTTLGILLLIMGASALYCFVVGELAHNNSQMDKLWSLLPEIYVWIVAARDGFSPRLVLMAVLVSLWGIRLTFNFARKGAYRVKFWEGKEDYRWEVLRASKDFQPRWKWMIFNFFFISLYQNLLVLLIALPALAAMGSSLPLGWLDYLAASLFAFFLLYELIADEEQWSFQSKKHSLLKEGKKLEELPSPYNKGFNTIGLWKFSRHPNYFAEQAMWICFYFFSVAAGLFPINWSAAGCLLLVVLFLGSCAFAEGISGAKYPLYAAYRKQVSCYFPWLPYRG